MSSWGTSQVQEETKERTRSRSRDKSGSRQASGGHSFGDNDQVALKLRGVPFRATE